MNIESSSGSAVHIRNLSVRRGRRVVIRGLDLDIPTGRLVGLLGPSGSGKSTLMRSILGVQSGVRGSVSVLGADAGDARLARRVAYASQSAAVYDDLTVMQNLGYFGAALHVGSTRRRRVLEEVGLVEFRGRLVSSLSGGQRNRVALAVAMLGEPDLLVLDEPTVGLDPVLRRDLWQVFRSLVGGGATVLVSSHVMDEATRCDDLVLLREGDILGTMTPQEMLSRTGASDPDAAFLTLVEQAGTAGGAAETENVA